MHLMENIYLVASGGLGLSHVTDGHVYLIDGGEEYALIDSGSGLDSSRIARNIEDAGFDLSKLGVIINTHSHWDHARGDSFFQRETGCRIIIQRNGEQMLRETLWKEHRVSELGFMAEPVECVEVIDQEATIHVGSTALLALATPGHSLDSITVLMTLKKGQIAFTGDTLVGEGCLGGGAQHGRTDFYVYRRSLQLLAEHRPEAILPGHKLPTLSFGMKYVSYAQSTLDANWPMMRQGITPFYPSWWLEELGSDILSMGRCP